MTPLVLILYLPIPRTVSHGFNQSMGHLAPSAVGTHRLPDQESIPGFQMSHLASLSLNWDVKRILILRLPRPVLGYHPPLSVLNAPQPP